MQISDLLGHYNSTATQSKPITANKGVEKLTSSIEGLSKGNIFEGTVSSVKGGKVILALSNGQTISARLEGKVILQPGQSMFFQVKSNNGTQVEIRPYTVEGGGNPTLLQALKAANLPTESQYITMVNTMMEEKMPIDRNSVSTMARMIQNNPEIDVKTLVQLEKLGLPISKEMASQFENYLSDKQAISSSMEEFMNELPTAMADEKLSAEQLKNIGHGIISVVTDNLEEVPQGSISIVEFENGDMYVNTFDDEVSLILDKGADNVQNPNVDATVTEAGTDVGSEYAQSEMDNAQSEMNNAVDNDLLQEFSQNTAINHEGIDMADNISEAVSQEKVRESVPNTLGDILSPKQIEELSRVVKEFLPAAVIKEDTSVISVLNEISRQLNDNPNISRQSILKLFSGDAFSAMVKDSLEQQWLIKPKDIENGQKVDRIYEQVKDQINKIEHIMKENGAGSSSVTNTANNIRSNVEFMNQINQTCTYVQIPLKMTGQNASGELYVYTNKKNLKDDNEELSAFLHLDMEHLGSTDVSVKLHKKDVTTNFYFENEKTYDLIEKFLPQLEEKLKNKGYNCRIYITNEDKHVNFVDDFLKKDQPSAGKLHRYSFDMRA